VEGTYEDCPKVPGTYDYAVGARGTGGTNYDVATVTVMAGKANADAPEAVGPVIDVFAVQPAEVAVNGCVQLNWTVGGAIQTIRILRDRVVLLDDAPKTGSGTDCLTETGVYRYRLEAVDEAGQRAEAEVEVTVKAMEATPIPSPAADATAPPTAGSNLRAIAGKTLVAISFRDVSGALISPLPGTEITAVFADGTLSGFGGCNQYSAGYQAGDGGSITLSPIAATQMFCGDPIGVMDQEAHYLSAIQTTAQLQTEGGLVTLLDGAGNPVAVYVSK
jgi:heat shock protein HslJ